jgi:hypothetical protein
MATEQLGDLMIGDDRFDLLVYPCRMTSASRTHALVLLFYYDDAGSDSDQSRHLIRRDILVRSTVQTEYVALTILWH